MSKAEEKYSLMDAFNDLNDDLPDGAFFALAEEMHGWDGDDWMWYSAEHERRTKTGAQANLKRTVE